MRMWEYVLARSAKKERDSLGAEGSEAVGLGPAASRQGAALQTVTHTPSRQMIGIVIQNGRRSRAPAPPLRCY